ncbi:MAG: hypothetical protein JXQ69_08115 [Paludibacteraceae bacterium]|nr:hypothetical protein [Paludibacteraceae bacterium]
MAILRKKIPASTLIEVIVAMVIILSSFGMAMMVIDSNKKSTHTHLLIKAEQYVVKEKEETLEKKLFLDEEKNFNGFSIVKTISDYNNTSDLRLLEIQALDKNKKLITKQQLLIIPE